MYLAAKGGIYERRSYDGVEWTKQTPVFECAGAVGVQAFRVRQKAYFLVAAAKKLYLYTPSEGRYVRYPYPVIKPFPATPFKAARSDGAYNLFVVEKGEFVRYVSDNCIDWKRETLKIEGLKGVPEGAYSPMAAYRFMIYSDGRESRAAELESSADGLYAVSETVIGGKGMKSGMSRSGKYLIYGVEKGEPFFEEAKNFPEAFRRHESQADVSADETSADETLADEATPETENAEPTEAAGAGESRSITTETEGEISDNEL